jgi:hypothetical protein
LSFVYAVPAVYHALCAICVVNRQTGEITLSQNFDTNNDGVLDREEFGVFVDKCLVRRAGSQVGTNLLVVVVLVPGLVFLTKRVLTKALKPVEPVSTVLEKVPTALLAVGYTIALQQWGLSVQ